MFISSFGYVQNSEIRIFPIEAIESESGENFSRAMNVLMLQKFSWGFPTESLIVLKSEVEVYRS